MFLHGLIFNFQLVTEFYGSSYFPDHFLGLEKHNNESLTIETGKQKLFEAASQKFNNNISSFDKLEELINKSKGHLESRNYKLEDHELLDISKTYDLILANNAKLDENKIQLEESKIKVTNVGNLLWTITTSIFVIGK